MSRGHARTRILLGIVFLSVISAEAALADAPIVNSFTANPQSLPNNWSTSISWNISNSAGQEIYFNCPQGVTIKNVSGSSFPCKTRQSVSGNPLDAAGFTIINVSGVSQNVPVTLYPKDASGVRYNGVTANLTLSVQTSAQPIIDFSLSSTSIASGAPLTLTWKGVDAGGVNVQFGCAESIRVRTSASGTDSLPCGKPAFSQDKAISGSLIVYPINSSRTPVSMRVTVLPDIGGNIYDATHSLSADFTVLGAQMPASPSASEFKSSVARLVSNDSVDFSWATQNSAGANIKFSCQEGISVFAVSSTTKIKLPCGTQAFAAPLAPSGTTTVSIANANGYSFSLEAMLMPQDSNGTYFVTSSRTLNITVYPAGTVLSSPTKSQSPSASVASSSSATTTQGQLPPAKANSLKYIFSRPLMRGSRNADVTALQKFLALYPAIYPAGAVTGFYGPATEKAVGLFQEKYGVAKKGKTGYGTVGPNTRAKLNAVQ
ncbi:MAG: peptidoglycan-binding domain-containing protein [bacterium]|nr:peptidoglycan-binding domain-containing protein [bacterium]